MEDITNQIIKNDPSEEKIRHICCIFLAIETVVLSMISFLLFGRPIYIHNISDFINVLKFHGIEFSEVVKYLLIRIIPCGLTVLFTILSMKNKIVYIIYEIMHIIFGALVAWVVCSHFNSVIIGPAILCFFYFRFYIYTIATRKAKRR